MDLGVTLERSQQVLEPVEGDRVAVLDGSHTERHREVGFPNTRWPLKQQAHPLSDPGADGQGLEPAALHSRLEGEVEVAQRVPVKCSLKRPSARAGLFRRGAQGN